MNDTQTFVLSHLQEHPGGASAQEIALNAPVFVDAIRRQLNALEARGEVYHVGERPRVWHIARKP